MYKMDKNEAIIEKRLLKNWYETW